MTTSLAGPAIGTGREQLPVPDVCDIPLGPQQACEQLGQAATGAASSVLDDLSDKMLRGMSVVLRMTISWWTNLPAPELTGANGQPGPALQVVRDYSGGLQVALLTGGIMFAAARLALAKRGGLAGEAQESFLMLTRATFTSMAFAAVITAGTQAGDQFANWVVFDASRGDLTGAVDRITEFDAPPVASLGSGLLLIVGLLGIISGLVQLVMLVMRQALLILVVAVIPLAAAASGTGPGSQAYKKLLSWSLAFVLYKPVGALVYAVAFTVIGSEKQTDSQQILLGVILLVMAVVVLPALARLVAPAVATLGGGGGASAVLAGGLAGVAMGSAGDRGSARKVSEGESSPGGAASGSQRPSGTTGPDGSGGGRPMGGTSDSGSATSGRSADSSGGRGGSESVSSGPATGKQSATPPGRGSNSDVASTTGNADGGGGGGGAAGPAVMVAQAAMDAGQKGVSAVDSQTRDAAEGGWNPDSLGPGEVRR